MTPTQRAAMEQALGCLVRAESMYGQPNAAQQDQLRAALAEPASAQEPIGWYWEYNGRPEGKVFFANPPDQDVIERGLSAEFPCIVRYVYTSPQAQKPAVDPAFLGYMNAGHLQKMQQGLLHSGYVYRDGGGIDEVAVFTAPQAQQPAPPADVPMLTPEEIDAALHVALPSLSYDSEDAFITGVRVGEKLVRQKAGLP